MTLLPIRPVEPMMRIRGFFASWYWVDMVAFSSFGSVFQTRTTLRVGSNSEARRSPIPFLRRRGALHPAPSERGARVARLHSTSVFGRAFAVRVSRRHVPTRGEADSDASIMIYGPKNDGTYIVEFRMADGEALAISVPASETRVLKHFQERMPYGLFVPDVDADAI
jgi:hypothetical protein